MENVSLSFTVTMSAKDLTEIRDLLGFQSVEAVSEWLAEMYYYYTKDHFNQFCISPMIDPT